MAHFELVPVEVWLAIALVVLAYAGLRWRRRRARDQRRVRNAARHRRNVAHARAWRWVFGQGKTLRLSDQRQPESD